MSEDILIKIAEQRAARLGFCLHSFSTRQYTILPGYEKEIYSFHCYYYIIDCPKGISLKSYLGEYDLNNPLKEEQVVEHSGIISIRNHTGDSLTVTLLCLVLQEHEKKDMLVRLTDNQQKEADNLAMSPIDYLKYKIGSKEIKPFLTPIRKRK